MERKVNGIGELIAAIREVKATCNGEIWYRGQAKAEWSLLPGILRQQRAISETTLLSRFKQSAAMLTESRPTSSFDWIFLMQHYGVPTRLLDWSENPLVALYFAVCNSHLHTEDDAAVWLLLPSELNKNANIVDKSEGDYIPSFDDDEVSGYSTESVRQSQRLQLFPIATIATRNNARIQAQMGTFTIHHNKSIPIETVGDGTHIRKFIIPKESRDTILSELSLLGVNKFSLFPEMESIGNILKEMMR
ncbi:FRG domain-containing protein [Pseudomonas retamae]|uniref:FRG domain-containing protein n=1 Tax=Pseudomonas retamae TaxID=702110 RepID=A0ABW7D5Z1_9PSED